MELNTCGIFAPYNVPINISVGDYCELKTQILEMAYKICNTHMQKNSNIYLVAK